GEDKLIGKTWIRALDSAMDPWQARGKFEDKELAAWASLHGWDLDNLEDRKLMLRQAALDMILQKLIPEIRNYHFPTPLEQLQVELPPQLLETARVAWAENTACFNYWGEVYNLLVPQAKRRQLGQFWTDENLANLMTAWLLEKTPQRLVDVGCGAGSFVDVPTLSVADFLEEDLLARSDAAICNPPYTRHHDIDPQRKDKLQNFLKASFRLEIPRQGTLAFYFLLKLIAE